MTSNRAFVIVGASLAGAKAPRTFERKDSTVAWY